MAIEVELKFPLLNPEDVTQALGEPKQDTQQSDTYLDLSLDSFLKVSPVARWLRIRRTPRGDSLNLKHWDTSLGSKGISCEEYESEVSDADAVQGLFEDLGYSVIAVVDKRRRTWHVDGVEIAVDDVKDLGTYIELEMKGEFEDEEEAEQQLTLVLSRLGAVVGEQDFDGYPLLLLKSKGLTEGT